MQTVLVTGAAGFIGSHVCVALLQAGFAVLGVDSLVNSKLATVARIAAVAGRALEFQQLDVCDTAGMAALCRRRELTAAIHLAGLKSAPESMRQPQRYLDCNVGGARSLLEALQQTGCRRLVFSSSACVYGRAAQNPVSEDQVPCPDHPYAQSKVEVEQQLAALVARDASWRVRVLRYFNPLGAHVSGLLGEDAPANGEHLMSRLLQVASGTQPAMPVFGTQAPMAVVCVILYM